MMRMNTKAMTKNNYCSQKFWFLSVNAERQEINSCCAAEYSKIDIKWLREHPGELFNTEQLKTERHQMLDDHRVSSCRSCWAVEDQNLPSRRLMMGSEVKTHTDIMCEPAEVSLFLGLSCNLTCSYCSKEYSTAWLHDVKNNGPYFDNDPRFNLTPYDQVILKLGQKAIQRHDNIQLLVDEIAKYQSVNKVVIAGGEPFLQNGLVDVVNKIPGKVEIFSGLGVTPTRFKNILESLPKDRVRLVVSAENVGNLYEFNRYGSKFNTFTENLNTIRQIGLAYGFNSVISNLTVFGFFDFLQMFKDENIFVQSCTDPLYLGPNVIDPESKQRLLDTDYGNFSSTIHQLIGGTEDSELKSMSAQFIKEFSRRRDLSLEIFPESFIRWLNV